MAQGKLYVQSGTVLHMDNPAALRAMLQVQHLTEVQLYKIKGYFQAIVAIFFCVQCTTSSKVTDPVNGIAPQPLYS